MASYSMLAGNVAYARCHAWLACNCSSQCPYRAQAADAASDCGSGVGLKKTHASDEGVATKLVVTSDHAEVAERVG